MKLTLLTCCLSILFGNFKPLKAQNVSTLVTDSTRRFEAMHWHADGRIYSVDYTNGNIYKIELNGSVQTIVSGFQNLAGGGFDLAGRFYFSDIAGGDIYRLNNNYTYTLVGSGFDQPVGILADSNNSDLLYVTEWNSSKVTKLSINTGVSTPFVTGNGVFGPDAVIYDWSGDNLLVSNWNNHKINSIDSAGVVTQFANIPVSGFMGYVDRIGNYLYVPSNSGKKIYRIDMSGNIQLIAGSGAIGHTDGYGLNATFTNPNGTCHNVAGDTLLVSDGNTIRVLTDFENTPVGIEDFQLETFKLYPNPAHDVINYSFKKKISGNLKWYIYNFEGKFLSTGSVSSEDDQFSGQINLDAFEKGTYIITFQTQSKKACSHVFYKIK